MKNSALKIIKKIEASGYEAFIVGGFVRDYLMDIKSTDVDICTNATPKEIKSMFKNIVLPNEKYGSVTLIYNKVRFEITTYRKEINYINNRFPAKIKYINHLETDLKRRDFTINTICMNSNGEIIDLLNGKDDIKNQMIRMVGNPKYRLKEDALRILRAIRFATIFNYQLDDKLKIYIKKYGYLLKKLSYFRKKEELDKIFANKNVLSGISLLKELNLEEFLEFSLKNVVVTSCSIGIWHQLHVNNKYPFTKNEKEIMHELDELKNKNLTDERIIYKYGLYLVTLAGEIKKIDRKQILSIYSNMYITSRKNIEISGTEISSTLGLKPTYLLKYIIDDIENVILIKKIKNNKDDIVKYLLDKYKL
ncbi:MAG: hypothetical protein PHE54_02370 [Bacilli bacterium]|nr:hypothetical protein [Bacilli bacterium]